MAFELIRKALASPSLPVLYQNSLPAVYNNPMVKPIGNEITYYPQDTGAGFIEKGYNLNDSIFSIVSKNARKFSQLRLYHRRVKANETKTLQEYFSLATEVMDLKAAKELRVMRKSMTEDYAVDSKMARLLNQPTRQKNQSDWLEEVLGWLDLTGEISLLSNRGVTNGPPLELLLIPKTHLNIIADPKDPWNVSAYETVIGGVRTRVPSENLMMWAYPNYLPYENPEHFRGQAPLQSSRILMQAMNEADERVAISNRNAGAAGLAFLKNLPKPTIEQSGDIRRQFNNAVNNAEMASKIAILGGEWGYVNFGYSLDQLKILEQYGLSFKRLCRVFHTPPGIFAESTDTYENVRQYKRDWIFDKINPSMAAFRGMLQEQLIEDFALNPERDFVDYDIMALPELSLELSEQVTALKGADWLTPNEKRDYCGYERLPDPNMDKVYAPSSITPLDELNTPVGGDLTNEMQDLNA